MPLRTELYRHASTYVEMHVLFCEIYKYIAGAYLNRGKCVFFFFLVIVFYLVSFLF